MVPLGLRLLVVLAPHGMHTFNTYRITHSPLQLEMLVRIAASAGDAVNERLRILRDKVAVEVQP
jgi:hypothetical protein